MSWPRLLLAVRPLPFLDSRVHAPGGVLEVRGRPAPRLLVWQPEMIDWIFRSDQRMRHPGSRTLAPLGARSLLWTDGPRHAAYRQVLGPPLRGRHLAEHRDLIAGTVHAAIDRLAPGSVVELLTWTRSIALHIIGRILLGRPDETVLASVTEWIEKAFGARHRTLAYRYLIGGPPKTGYELDRLLVAAARALPHRQPIPLAARLLDGHGPLGGLGDAELRDTVLSMLFAGHETTAAAAAWTLYWLDRHASVRHDVQAELAATSSDGSDASRLPLLQAVILEALRLTPPAPFAEHRMLTEDDAFAGRALAAGTIMTPAIYPAHHHPDAFPKPRTFDPNRFLGGRPDPRHYLPFGGGTRYCLGNQLAQLELRMIIAAVLRRREWRSVNPSAGVPRLRGHVVAPAASLRMRVISCRD